MTTDRTSPAMGMLKADFDRFVPNRGLMVLKREPEDTDAGHGLVLVEQGEDKRRKDCSRAMVVRLGPPDRDDKKGTVVPWSVKPGDVVILDRWAGHDVEIAETGERYVVTGENDVVCVLDPV